MICFFYLQSFNRYYYLRVYGVFDFLYTILYKIVLDQGIYFIVKEDYDYGIYQLYYILYYVVFFRVLEWFVGGIFEILVWIRYFIRIGYYFLGYSENYELKFFIWY